jgi:hypothetical protein
VKQLIGQPTAAPMTAYETNEFSTMGLVIDQGPFNIKKHLPILKQSF